MRVVAKGVSLRQALWWTQAALVATALLLFAYCAFVLFDAWGFQRRAEEEFGNQLESGHVAAVAKAAVPVVVAARPLVRGSLIGSIAIPRLGLWAAIAEGTDTTTLRRAVGHIRSTGLPGQVANVGLAAHRDTFFRPLKDVRRDDVVTVKTSEGEYHYRVVSTRVVVPTEVSVLDSGSTEILTLVTCHPFDFLGSAPDRFIVRAERVD